MWELGVALEAMLSARCLKIRTQECGYIECIKCTPGLKLLLVQLHEYVESGTVTNHCTCRANDFITMKNFLVLAVPPNLFCLALHM